MQATKSNAIESINWYNCFRVLNTSKMFDPQFHFLIFNQEKCIMSNETN